MFGRFLLRYVFLRCNRVTDLVCDSCPCRSRAKDDNAHISDMNVADMQAGHQRSQRNAACSLYVVIETRYLRAEFVQQPSRVPKTKIFTVEMSFFSQNSR